MTEITPWERQPKGGGWTRLPTPPMVKGDIVRRSSVWTDGKHSVISTVNMAELPNGDGAVGPQWHLSISCFGKRPKPRDVARILRVFGMVGAEEDNHHPGNARHFWRPIDPRYRVSCECKATEATVVEPDGYTWTNPKPETDEECRGCEFARRFGKPCPIHSEKALVR